MWEEARRGQWCSRCEEVVTSASLGKVEAATVTDPCLESAEIESMRESLNGERKEAQNLLPTAGCHVQEG